MIRVRVTLEIDAPDGASARNVMAFAASWLPSEHPWCPRVVAVAFPWDIGPNAPTPLVPPILDEDLPPTHRQGEPR